MDARRARVLAGSAILMSLLAATSAGPAAAADCALSAPAYVNVGSPLTIEGTGFPASTSVDISFSIDGSASDAFSVQSSPAGVLEIALTPEDADIGVTTVKAKAGSACTASATYAVLAAGQTPAASPKAAASSSPRTGPKAPRTDAEDAVVPTGWSGGTPLGLALALVAVGAAGLWLTRSARRP
jgi:hypothetical protein